MGRVDKDAAQSKYASAPAAVRPNHGGGPAAEGFMHGEVACLENCAIMHVAISPMLKTQTS